jgi:hypothetical protein
MTNKINTLEKLSRLIVEHELATSDEASKSAALCFQKLRAHISRVMGVTGYRALLTRSLHLATKKNSFFSDLDISELGELRGFAESEHQVATVELLLVTFFELLKGFIGETLLMSLLSDIWPEEVSQAKKEAKK